MNDKTPRVIEARGEIARLKAAGYGPSDIARTLNARGVATPSGRGKWWPETVLRHGDPAAAEAWRQYIADYRRRKLELEQHNATKLTGQR